MRLQGPTSRVSRCFKASVAHSPTARSGRPLLLSAALDCLVSETAGLSLTLISFATVTAFWRGRCCNKGC
jgi:hypothetical protein